jgi:S1-C subfamily serine protease
VEKINISGEKRILEFIAHLIEQLPSPDSLKFTPTRNPDKGNLSFKVTLGIMPDYSYEGKGVKVDGVSENKPAFKAGIKTGDIIVELDGKKIQSVMDYMKVLSTLKKGMKVGCVVQRNNKTIRLQVEL